MEERGLMKGSLTGRSILIVEDEPIIVMDITQAFEDSGAELTEVIQDARTTCYRRDPRADLRRITPQRSGAAVCFQLCATRKPDEH
jgi:CheY-like chemotaxis protein